MHRAGALVFAAMPILVGILALGRLQSPPAREASVRTLRVAADDRSIAWKSPGEAAISLARLPALSFEHLPFDLVTTETGEIRYKRARVWSLVDDWNNWDVSLDGAPCRDRTPDGGWTCRGAAAVKPDLVDVRGELWAVAVISEIESGHRLVLRASFAPVQVTASLIPLSDRRLPPTVTLERGGRRVESGCSDPNVCRVVAPEGAGSLLLEIDGPSPAFGVDLRAQP